MYRAEVSREAADLILLNDNFSTIIDTIKDGRRIYDNIQKSIGYVFSIHIPIALASLLAPFLNINPAALMLLPLHVVLLELVVDPTCSIVLERQPAESDIMKRRPRRPNEKIVTVKGLIKYIIQGLVIFVTSFGSYLYFLQKYDSTVARTIGIVIIIFANIFLVVVNSSRRQYAYQLLSELAKDKVFWAITSTTFIGSILLTYSPLNHILKLSSLSFGQFVYCILTGFISVFWYEFVKYLYNRKKIYVGLS